MKFLPLIFLFLVFVPVLPAMAQGQNMEALIDDDLQIDGGDIFSDFNEDIESGQVLEYERYYRYGRFYTVSASLGLTQFTGNRGSVYENSPPTFGLGVSYFFNFQTAFVMGFESSKHNFLVEVPTKTSGAEAYGLIEVRMFRAYGGIRYYLDTTNLGTALTYANPYITGRFEYWYHTNKYIDRDDVPDKNYGDFGTSLGGGLEFPMEIKESYLGVQALYHKVGFDDKLTTDYRANDGSSKGVQNLNGDVITLMVSYVLSW